MKKMSCAIAIVFSSALFSGCEANRFVSSERARDAVKSALQARRIGQIFDAGTRAIADDDLEKLARNCDELHQLKATREADLLCLMAAENAIVEAVRLESVDRISSTRSARNTALATQKYRLALRLSPDFPSQNSMLLNALGYFLADRGDSNSDFVTAEKLTRRALQMDAKQPTNALFRKSSDANFNRANIRDSLAWSLFRQGKFAAAQHEQKQAMSDARAAIDNGASDPNGDGLKEMTSHWQQID